MRILAYLGAVLLAAAPAHATVLRWNFTGTVNPDVVPSLYPLASGTAFSGSIRVDTGATSQLGDPAIYGPGIVTVFDPGSALITIDLGDQHIVQSSHAVVRNPFGNPMLDEIDLLADTPVPFTPNISFRYFDLGNPAIESNAFPTALPLGGFAFADISVTGVMFLPDPAAPPWIYQFTGHVEALSAAVPEPASWAMMVAGFGLVGGALRRARKIGVRRSPA